MNDAVDDFITRWKPSGGNEIANFQSFAAELTQLLSLEARKPATSDGQTNDYRFERPVDLSHTGTEIPTFSRHYCSITIRFTSSIPSFTVHF